jgi:hypothetical protein
MENKIRKIIKSINKCYALYADCDCCREYVAEVMALFTQSVEEQIIGKDELERGSVEVRIENRWRNELRAEQRARLATLIKQ